VCHYPYTESAIVPPAAYPSSAPDGRFWYGTDALWTTLDVDSKWHTQHNVLNGKGYRTKLIFWRPGFDWRKESEPRLIITAKRLDVAAPSVVIAQASAVLLTGPHVGDDDWNRYTDSWLLGTYRALQPPHFNVHCFSGALGPD
jgi:hypothetical protein